MIKKINSLLATTSRKMNEHSNSIVERICKELKDYTNEKKREARLVLNLFEYLERQDKIDLIEFFDDILNPVANNFRCVSVNNYDIKSKLNFVSEQSGQEIWTDSECLFIKLPYLQTNKNFNLW